MQLPRRLLTLASLAVRAGCAGQHEFRFSGVADFLADTTSRDLRGSISHGATATHATATSAATTTATTTKPFGVTLVMQASSDRCWMVSDICGRWGGPVALAVFVPRGGQPFRHPDNDAAAATAPAAASADGRSGGGGNSALAHVFGASGSGAGFGAGAGCRRGQVAMVTHLAASSAEAKAYPVNVLRNLATALVNTSHFLVADVDFWPSAALREAILSHLPRLLEASADPKREALVVPAFARVGDRPCSSAADCRAMALASKGFMPADLAELKACVDKRKCIVFQADNNIDGHATTNSKAWMAHSQATATPRRIECFESSRYEPYLVLPTPNTALGAMTPAYDERFSGYGKNKIQFVQHVRYAGFAFSVLPLGFLVHFPHQKSEAKVEWLNNEAVHRGVDQQYARFISELSKTYLAPQGVKQPHTPMCSRGGSAGRHPALNGAGPSRRTEPATAHKQPREPPSAVRSA